MSDEYTNIKIYVTTNYDQFIFLKENRDVTGNTVLNSINKKNLLIDNPILVSQNMEVLDGQNRLIAAKTKKAPIYYRIAQVTRRGDISLLQNQKPWLIKDHAHFYESKDNYRFINEISEKYNLPLHFVISCCDPSKNAFRKFKNGELEIKDVLEELTEKFQKFTELINILKILLATCEKKTYTITQKFKRSLWSFMRRKDYCHQRLIHGFNTYPDHVIQLLTINSEQLIFQGLDKRVFNYNRKGKRTYELD
jgi:hypothetical protein